MLTWCEVSQSALAANLQALRQHLGPAPLLAPTVKGNAYGHGLELAARAFLEAGADWLCVNALYEARALRQAGIQAPLYLVGYVGRHELEEALALDCDLVLYNHQTFEEVAALAQRRGQQARLHLKLETGNNRQGLRQEQALELARRVHQHPHTRLRGLSSHYANIEDTTDHSFARAQLARFEGFVQKLHSLGIHPELRHMANSAACLLWPQQALDLARPGIAAYGMWPSPETLVAALLSGHRDLKLQPALRWLCRIAQLKEVPAGEYIGYGCTYRATHPTRLAILPVGYYDGYDRKLSNTAHVLIDGQRAPVRGRVCMNILMVDVTDIPQATLEQEVVLLGSAGEGQESITAEQMGAWANTINYEITTRINERIPRVAAP